MMEAIVHWVREDPSELGRPQLMGATSHASMAVPMMLLNLVDQLSEGDAETASRFKELGSWSAQQILTHLQVLGWDCPAPPPCPSALLFRFFYIYNFIILTGEKKQCIYIYFT